jgi:hypothetical protein
MRAQHYSPPIGTRDSFSNRGMCPVVDCQIFRRTEFRIRQCQTIRLLLRNVHAEGGQFSLLRSEVSLLFAYAPKVFVAHDC